MGPKAASTTITLEWLHFKMKLPQDVHITHVLQDIDDIMRNSFKVKLQGEGLPSSCHRVEGSRATNIPLDEVLGSS